MMKTRAAVLHEMELARPYSETNPLKIEEVELEAPGADEVIVKVRAAGLCHSDLSVIDGNRPRPLPMVLGHEASGEIIELGKNVERFKVGDHVIFSFLPSCGHCLNCATGKAALCEPGAKSNGEGVLMGGHKRIKKGNEYYHHHLGVSGFSEYVVASVNSLVRIDRDVPSDIAALFGCAVMTGVGAVVNTAQAKLGDMVLVVGLGGVGLSAIMGAQAAGARKIIGADINPQKRQVALDLGAHHVVDSSKPEALEEIRDLTNGGVDIAVEFAGVIPALDFALEATRRGGTAVTAALPHPEARLSVSPTMLVGMEKSLKGSYLGSCVAQRDIPNFLDLYRSRRLQVDRLITHRIGLEDINEGFDRLANGEAIRQVVLFDQ